MSLLCTSNPCPNMHDQDHMQRFQHVGQPIRFNGIQSNQGNAYYVSDQKKKCPYGNSCQLLIQGDEYHFFSYTHNHEPESTPQPSHGPGPAMPKPSREICPQESGAGVCHLASQPEHAAKYQHLTSGNVHPMPMGGHNTHPGYPNPHLYQPQMPSSGVSAAGPTIRCPNYDNCPLTRGNPAHCDQFKHKCDHGKRCINQHNAIHLRRFDH